MDGNRRAFPRAPAALRGSLPALAASPLSAQVAGTTRLWHARRNFFVFWWILHSLLR
ncbi:MAG: hypothetical protein ACLQIB_43400 [Isosphaeraceae bacterium]